MDHVSNHIDSAESGVVIEEPLEVLNKLYSNEDQSMKFLKICRINPNFDQCHINRSDLEFYIPQLWFCLEM